MQLPINEDIEHMTRSLCQPGEKTGINSDHLYASSFFVSGCRPIACSRAPEEFWVMGKSLNLEGLL